MKSDFTDSQSFRILIIRPDRLGDVLLSTPVFEVIKKNYPRSHLTVLIKKEHFPLLKNLPSIDHLMVFDPKGKHSGFPGFFRLFLEIKRRHFRVAIALQSNWKIALSLFFSGIHYRVGPYSKLYSFFLYNRGVRQHRSQVQMHEVDYNLQLLRKLGIRTPTRSVLPKVALSCEIKERARVFLEKKNWNAEKKTIAIHPGMGGSALNWPEAHYQELVKLLLHAGMQVLLTGGLGDRFILNRLMKGLESSLKKILEALFLYEGENSIDFLAGLFSLMDVVVAPSTGPLHLAVALNRPVVSFFSPIRVQSAIRWGPYLNDESHASVLVPEVYCGQDFKCRGSACHYFPCMKGLTVQQAMDEILFQLNRSKPI